MSSTACALWDFHPFLGNQVLPCTTWHDFLFERFPSNFCKPSGDFIQRNATWTCEIHHTTTKPIFLQRFRSDKINGRQRPSEKKGSAFAENVELRLVRSQQQCSTHSVFYKQPALKTAIYIGSVPGSCSRYRLDLQMGCIAFGPIVDGQTTLGRRVTASEVRMTPMVLRAFGCRLVGSKVGGSRMNCPRLRTGA